MEKTLNIELDRPSPLLSATCFPEGYILFNVIDKTKINKNNDYNLSKNSYNSRYNLSFWIISSKSGSNKWIPLVNKFYYQLNKEASDFIIPREEEKNFLKITDIALSKKLFIGEMSLYEFNIKSGKYSIYSYEGCVIICPSNKFNKIFNNKFTNTKLMVGDDGETCGFYNGDLFKFFLDEEKKPYLNILKDYNLYYATYVNNGTVIINRKELGEYTVGYIHNSELIKKIIEFPEDIVGFMTEGVGESPHLIYSNKKDNIYIIESNTFINNMYNIINHFYL